ncbi:MAG: hypothetical protein Kow0069_08590 [Promethearchaeota archaeon]
MSDQDDRDSDLGEEGDVDEEDGEVPPSDDEVVAMALAVTGTPAEAGAMRNWQCSTGELDVVVECLEMWKNRAVQRNLKDKLADLVRSNADRAGELVELAAAAAEFHANCPKFSSREEYGKALKERKVDEKEAEEGRERGKALMGAFFKGR